MVEIPGNTHDFSDDYETLPPGEYLVEIAHIECKTSKHSQADYLSVRFRTMAGDYTGRSIFTNLNLWHPNEKAQWYAQKELQEICQACGLDRSSVSDTDELEGKQLIAKVVHRNAGDRVFVNIDRYTEAKPNQPPRQTAPKTDGPDDIPW